MCKGVKNTCDLSQAFVFLKKLTIHLPSQKTKHCHEHAQSFLQLKCLHLSLRKYQLKYLEIEFKTSFFLLNVH